MPATISKPGWVMTMRALQQAQRHGHRVIACRHPPITSSDEE